jgi:hypothetical protein
MHDAVRVSLWAEGAPLLVVSSPPVPISEFKHPDGKPQTYAAARWVLENLFAIVSRRANDLIPYARLIASESQNRSSDE